MSAGTLTLTNNSDVATGSGTSFTKDLEVGDFIVIKSGGITYTLPVKTIESDVSLTLSREYNGPTASELAWTAMPRDTLNRISAQIAADTAYIIRQRVLEVDNWYQLLEVNGDVTIVMADGSTYTGPSWLRLIELMKELDLDVLMPLIEQVHLDAEQVAIDREAVRSDLKSAGKYAEAAASANDHAQSAKDEAEKALALSTSEAEASRKSAEDAQTAQAAAEQAAATVQPENLLQNANSLDDLTDKPAARQNLDVFSKEEIADMLPGFLGQIDWQEMRTALEPGTAPRDGQEVEQTGIFADLYAKALAGKLPTCTEAEWQSDPLNRGCYVLESSPGKMRLPDDNGVQPGSLKIPVHVGDGGDSSVNGKMGASALPNIKGTLYRLGATSSLMRTDSIVDGAFELLEREFVSPPTQGATIAAITTGLPLGFNARASNGMYQDGVTEIRANRVQGCWTVRYASKATNGGSIDALALATAITAGDAELLAKIIATNARIDYAVISPEGTYAVNTRTMYENPFGNDTPVICIAEFFHATLQKWITTVYTWTGSNASYGLQAAFQDGEGISVVSGQTGFGISASGNGASVALPANYATASPIRIKVWKITA